MSRYSNNKTSCTRPRYVLDTWIRIWSRSIRRISLRTIRKVCTGRTNSAKWYSHMLHQTTSWWPGKRALRCLCRSKLFSLPTTSYSISRFPRILARMARRRTSWNNSWDRLESHPPRETNVQRSKSHEVQQTCRDRFSQTVQSRSSMCPRRTATCVITSSKKSMGNSDSQCETSYSKRAYSKTK